MVIKEQQKELVILIGCGLILTVAAWAIAITPALSKLKRVKLQVMAESMKTGLASEVQALQLKNKADEDLLTGEMTQHNFIARISTLAKENGVKFESLIPASEVEGAFTKLKLDLTTQASFPTLIKFLDQLEEFKPVVIVSKISILTGGNFRRRDQKSDIPQANFTLETYLRKK